MYKSNCVICNAELTCKQPGKKYCGNQATHGSCAYLRAKERSVEYNRKYSQRKQEARKKPNKPNKSNTKQYFTPTYMRADKNAFDYWQA